MRRPGLEPGEHLLLRQAAKPVCVAAQCVYHFAMPDSLPDTSDMTAYHRAYYHAVRRRKALDFLGGRCVFCGSTDDLQFDHVDPHAKSFDIGENLTLSTIEDELRKCQLLCGPCHRAKTTRERRPFQHGTIYGFMKMKCACADCAARKREWHDARNKARLKPNGRGAYGPRS